MTIREAKNNNSSVHHWKVIECLSPWLMGISLASLVMGFYFFRCDVGIFFLSAFIGLCISLANYFGGIEKNEALIVCAILILVLCCASILLMPQISTLTLFGNGFAGAYLVIGLLAAWKKTI